MISNSGIFNDSKCLFSLQEIAQESDRMKFTNYEGTELFSGWRNNPTKLNFNLLVLIRWRSQISTNRNMSCSHTHWAEFNNKGHTNDWTSCSNDWRSNTNFTKCLACTSSVKKVELGACERLSLLWFDLIVHTHIPHKGVIVNEVLYICKCNTALIGMHGAAVGKWNHKTH